MDRTCCLQGVSEHRFHFSGLGVASPTAPGEFSGVTAVIIELAEHGQSPSLSGWFNLRIRSAQERQGSASINVEDSDNTAIYCVIEGPSLQADAEELSESTHVRVQLTRTEKSAPLDQLLRREEVVVLRQRGRTATVLQIHAGKRLVLGRCYAYQLHSDAVMKLEQFNSKRVNWVTNWDDASVHQLSLCLEHTVEHGQASLLIQNLTDYSRYASEIKISGARKGVVRPGETSELPLSDRDSMTFVSGSESSRCELVKLCYEEVTVGDVKAPVYQSHNSNFDWTSPEKDRLKIRFLGVWIPMDPTVFSRLLAAGRPESLTVNFSEVATSLWFRSSENNDQARVSSSIDLVKALREG
jgi:hypothetical protein